MELPILTKKLLNSSAIFSESVMIFSFCNLFGADVLIFLFVKSFIASQIFLALFLYRVKKLLYDNS